MHVYIFVSSVYVSLKINLKQIFNIVHIDSIKIVKFTSVMDVFFFLSFTPLDSDNVAASLFRPIREGGGSDWFLPRDDVHRALPPASGDGGSVPP